MNIPVVDVRSDGDYHEFEAALRLALCREGAVVGYDIVPTIAATETQTMVLQRWDAKHPFPAPVGLETAARLAWDWLASLDNSQRPVYPGIDGGVELGWRVHSMAGLAATDRSEVIRDTLPGYGHGTMAGAGDLVAITPCWILYGK